MDITKHLEKADEAVRRKNFDGAIALYQQLIELQPGDFQARRGLMSAAAKRYEYKKPMKAMLFASASPSIAAAKSCQAMKRWSQAADQYQKAALLDPTNASWCLTLGECLEMASFPDAALAVYEHLAEIDPKNLEALKRSGALRYQKKDLSGALEFYEKALAVNPRDQDSLKARKNLAAEGILQEKGFETATSSRELIKDRDRQKELEQSQRIHKTEDEIAIQLQALQGEASVDPNNVKTLERIGRLHESRGDLDAAIETYKKALALDTTSFDLKTKLDELGLKRFDREIEELKKNASTDPTTPEKIKRVEEKRLNFELKHAGDRAVEHPTDLGLRYKYGRLLFRVGQFDAAIAELQKAVNDPRWRLDCYVTLGQCFHQKGLYDLARRQLEKALELIPSGSARAKEILYNLGLVAERMNALADASGYYSRIYEIDISYKDVASKIEKLRSQ